MTKSAAANLALAGGNEQLDKVVAQLSGKEGEIPLVDLMAAAEQLVGSMHTIFGALDSSIFREFGSIAGSINRARDEIGKLQPQDITDDHIPSAGRELHAIITATEDATNTIMESAENLLELDAKDLETYKAAVSDEVMRIFEACSFQDITGQRVGKVVEALEDIDERVSRIASAFGAVSESAEKSEREEKRDARKCEQILHGPALEGEGVNQTDVDEMMAGDQASIDALFD